MSTSGRAGRCRSILVVLVVRLLCTLVYSALDKGFVADQFLSSDTDQRMDWNWKRQLYASGVICDTVYDHSAIVMLQRRFVQYDHRDNRHCFA